MFVKARVLSYGGRRRHHMKIHCVAQDQAKDDSSESKSRLSEDSWIDLNTPKADSASSDWFGNSEQYNDSGQKYGVAGEIFFLFVNLYCWLIWDRFFIMGLYSFMRLLVEIGISAERFHLFLLDCGYNLGLTFDYAIN